MKIAFITNICSHYRVKLFEKISENYNTQFVFFSKGNEWYSEKKNKIHKGKFKEIHKNGLKLFSHLLFSDYDIVIKCINNKLNLLISFFYAKLFGKCFILWTGVWMQPKTIFHILTFPLIKFIYKHSDAIVVYGKHIEKYLNNLGVKSEKIFIAWNTIDNDLFNSKVLNEDELQIKKSININNEKVILYVGRLSEEKGLEYLFEAFFMIQKELDIVLLIIGEGSKKKFLENMVYQLQLKKIFFLNYVANNDLHKYYSMADVFVLPSISTKKVKEPWGLVVNEAMNQGCPIIVTNAVGAAVGGLIDDGINGFVVEEKNSGELAKVITKILTNDDLSNSMREASFEKIKNWNYDFQVSGFFNAIRYVNEK